MTVNDACTGQSTGTISKRLRLVRPVLAYLAIGSTVVALSCFLSYELDCSRLRAVSTLLIEGRHAPAEKVIALLDWVHGNQSTAENRRYFVLPRLRATSCQVLESGGDCADKSRLLSAMLRAIGIPAGMAMCFDPRTGNPTHTVVVATLAHGKTMVVDPAYNLFFPALSVGEYYGLLDLRADPTILGNRLDDLSAQLPRRHPVHSYNREAAGYSRASCINWDANVLTRLVKKCFLAENSEAIHAIPRPLILEEPKLMIGAGALLTGLFAVTARGSITWFMRLRSFSPSSHTGAVKLQRESDVTRTIARLRISTCGR